MQLWYRIVSAPTFCIQSKIFPAHFRQKFPYNLVLCQFGDAEQRVEEGGRQQLVDHGQQLCYSLSRAVW